MKRWFPRTANVGIVGNILVRLAAGVALVVTTVKAAELGGWYWLLAALCAVVAVPAVVFPIAMAVLLLRGEVDD